MDTKGDVNNASTTYVGMDGKKKNQKGRKHQKGNEEVLSDPSPSEALTSHPPLTDEASDNEVDEDAIDVINEEELFPSVEVESQALEILGKCMNVADIKFKTLEDFTLEEDDNIHK